MFRSIPHQAWQHSHLVLVALPQLVAILQVYCVLRAKKGKTPADRLKELFNSPIFRLLQPSLPNLKDKVQLINADLAEPNCGLAPADQELLVRSVLQLEHLTNASEDGQSPAGCSICHA